MPLYDYKVKDKAGNTRTGQLEANDERHAAAMIREAGGLPMDIRPARGTSPASPVAPAGSAFVRYLIHPFWTGVNIRHLMFFFTQLATLLGAGMSLSEALRSVANRSRGSMGRIVRSAQVRVQGGGRLSDEMARFPRVFSALQVSLIRAGEETGLIESMTDRIAGYLEYELTIRRRILLATFYPILVVIVFILKPAVVAYFVKDAHAAGLVLMASLKGLGVPFVIFLVMAKLVFQFQPPRLVWDEIKTSVPILGMVAKKIAMSRFCKALALLYASGIPITRAVSIAADASANLALARKLKMAVPGLNEGHSLTEALARTGAVLPMVMEMLSVGEQTGSQEVGLQKVADYMDAEADATIQKLSILLFVSMILAVGIMVAMDILGQFMSYFGNLEKAGGP